MKITYQSRELTTAELYMLTMSPEIGKMSEVTDQSVIDIDSWVIYKDVDSNGVEQEILSIRDIYGEVCATNSPTFIREFNRMQELFDMNNEKVEKIKVVKGTSKAGRQFITCSYSA